LQKYSPLLLFALSGIACRGNELEKSAELDIGAHHPAALFRKVTTTGGVIALGMPLDQSLVASRISDSLIQLTARSIKGVDRAYVVVSATGLVRAVMVDYSFNASYEKLLSAYTASFGNPTRAQIQRQGEEPVNLALWRDARTEFRLIHDRNRNAWTVRSELRDR
jgi:hypothetical protein